MTGGGSWAAVIAATAGKTVAQAPVTMDSFYAHTDTPAETTLGGKLQPGDYTVSLTLTDPTTKASATGTNLPFTVAEQTAQNSTGPQQGQLPQILQDAGTGASPYLIAIAIAIAIAVLAGLAVVFFLHRRNRRPRTRSLDERGRP